MVSQPKKPAAAMINNRLMVCLMESQKTLVKFFNDKSLYKNPKNNAYKDATTAASVGVNHPVKMPPMMITGVSRGKKAVLTLWFALALS